MVGGFVRRGLTFLQQPAPDMVHAFADRGLRIDQDIVIAGHDAAGAGGDIVIGDQFVRGVAQQTLEHGHIRYRDSQTQGFVLRQIAGGLRDHLLQVLKKLAENERNKAQYELAALSHQRQELRKQREQAVAHIRQVREQKEKAIRMTVQAGTLMMYDELISEQNTLIARLDAAIDVLHGQEQALLRQWLSHDSRGKAFDRIDKKFITEANRVLDRKLQQIDDDRVAGRLTGPLAAGV